MEVKPGTLLMASVQLHDGVFDQTVVLLLDADDSGALGVVLNRISPLDLESVLPGWMEHASVPDALFDGGPVSPDGAICLSSPMRDDEEPMGWRPLFDRVGLLHLDTPLEIAQGAHRDLRIFAGYAGWGPGQLQAEIEAGYWYVTRARYADVFDPDPETLWRRALRREGGELGLLSTWTHRMELN
jgi:putative transcriptional regulator